MKFDLDAMLGLLTNRTTLLRYLRVCTSKNKVNIAVRAPLVARDSHRTIFRSWTARTTAVRQHSVSRSSFSRKFRTRFPSPFCGQTSPTPPKNKSLNLRVVTRPTKVSIRFGKPIGSGNFRNTNVPPAREQFPFASLNLGRNWTDTQVPLRVIGCCWTVFEVVFLLTSIHRRTAVKASVLTY